MNQCRNERGAGDRHNPRPDLQLPRKSENKDPRDNCLSRPGLMPGDRLDERLYLQREEMPMGVGSILRFFLPQDDKSITTRSGNTLSAFMLMNAIESIVWKQA
jgi:hypothetical protein